MISKNLALGEETCHGSIQEKIQLFSSYGFTGIDIKTSNKNGDEHSHLTNIKTAKEHKKILDDYGVTVTSTYKLQGWFELDGGLMGVRDKWYEIFDECKRQIEISQILGTKYIITAPARSNRGYNASLFQGAKRYFKLWEYSKQSSVSLAMEFMGQTQQINTYDKCIDFLTLFGDLKNTNMKLILDTYHIWRGGNDILDVAKKVDLNNVGVIHLCDADTKIDRDKHMASARPVITDGGLNLKKFISHTKNFTGYYSMGCYLYKNKSCKDVVPLFSKKLNNLFNTL